MVEVTGGDKPAKRLGNSLLGGLLVELVVELARVDGELQLPRGQQDRSDDERWHERSHRYPAQHLQTLLLDGGRTEKGRDYRVGRQQCARALPDPRDQRLLVCKRRAPRLMRNLLERGHASTVGSPADGDVHSSDRGAAVILAHSAGHP